MGGRCGLAFTVYLYIEIGSGKLKQIKMCAHHVFHDLLTLYLSPRCIILRVRYLAGFLFLPRLLNNPKEIPFSSAGTSQSILGEA